MNFQPQGFYINCLKNTPTLHSALNPHTNKLVHTELKENCLLKNYITTVPKYMFLQVNNSGGNVTFHILNNSSPFFFSIIVVLQVATYPLNSLISGSITLGIFP